MRLFFIILILFALLILAICCPKEHSPDIEADLTSRTRMQIDKNAMSWANVSIDGRDIILKGNAPTQELSDKVEYIAKNVWGVRVVNNQLSVIGGAVKNIVPNPYLFSLVSQGQKITLSGYVTNKKQKNDVIKQLSDLFGKDNITDNLKIASGAPENWGEFIGSKIVKNVKYFDHSKFELKNNMLSVVGQVPSSDVKKKLLAKLPKKTNSNYKINLDIKYKKVAAKKAPVKTSPNIDIAPKKNIKVVSKEAKSCQKNFRKLLAKERVFFKSNSTKLDITASKVLQKLVTTAKNCINENIKIAGHTDATGDAALNIKLSKARAMSVAEYMVSHGIKSARLKVIGFGEIQPIASNKTASGRAKNRRIEFIVGD